MNDIIGPERAAAACQTAQIESYWHNRGHTQVKTWLEKGRIPERDGRPWNTEMWFVRSNLINGMPPQ